LRVNLWVVGLVASVAGDASGVICGCDLRKGFGLGAVGFVAAGADDGVELRWFHGGGIVSMLGLGSVAGFAGDDDVFALLLLFHHVGMAGLAHVVAGMGYGTGGGFGDGGAAIVSVLAEGARDDGGAQEKECHQSDRHNGGEADEVFDVLKQSDLSAAELQSRFARENAQCSWIAGIRARNDD
jgi:hypothetical protein